jgi:transposase
LSNEEWARLESLLPSQKGKRGHPYKEHRRVIDGIRWRARTGAPWRDIPERYGPWQTCYDRFVRWQRRGIWPRILQTLQGAADAAGELVWTHCSIDGSVVRAHQHAAGARHTPAAAPVAAAVDRVPDPAPSAPSTGPAGDPADARAAEKGGPRRSLGKRSVGAGAGSQRSCIWPSTGGGGRWGSM